MLAIAAPTATVVTGTVCRCADVEDRAVADRSRWMSHHRTSIGITLYYRCFCGRPRVSSGGLLSPGGLAARS